MKTPAALRALTQDLIDYAGLFPPASLDMKRAVANYAAYLEHEAAWMLARFITPAKSLDDFQTAFDTLDEKPLAAWRISALSTPATFNENLRRVTAFNEINAERCAVDAFEIKVETIDEIKGVMRQLKSEAGDSSFDVFFEITLNDDAEKLIAATGFDAYAPYAHAKIRTGGVEPNNIPSSESVLRFIRTCPKHFASFKATAGLHHPVRAEQNLTYETNAPRAVMHGFLNVFLAAAFILDGMNDADTLRLLEETDAAAFAFTDEVAAWREHKITIDKLQIARLNFAFSFGSCSFTEPVEDLQKLNLL